MSVLNRLSWVLFLVCNVLYAIEPKIILEEDPTLLISSFRVVVLAGSVQDPGSKIGLNNMMAELMLRGTKKRTREKFQSELEKMGASLGVSTTQTNTTFYGTVIKENTDKFLALLDECLVNPAFTKAEFTALKQELVNEITNMKNQNNRLGGMALSREAFAGTTLSRPSRGSVATLSSIELSDVQRAYNDHFHRGNILFGVAAPSKAENIKKSLTAIWLRFPDGAKLATRSITPKSASAPMLIVVHKPGTKTGSIVFGQPGIVANDPDRYSLGVGNFSFGGEPLVSRLFRTVRGELGWTYSISSTYSAMGAPTHQQGMFVIASTPAVEFTAKTILKVMAMWNEYMEKGLEKKEMTLAQESIVNSYPFDFDSAQKRVSLQMDSYLYGVPVLNPEQFKKTIDGIDNKQIIAALKKRQLSNGWWITVVADKDEVAKQLEAEQKDIPKEKRLTIARVYTPDELIEQSDRKVLKVD